MKQTKKSPKAKAIKKAASKVKADEKQSKPKVVKELIPMNEDPTTWKIDLNLTKDKEGMVVMPVKGTFIIPLVSGQKIKVHGKLQDHLKGIIEGYDIVRGGGDENEFAIAMNRYSDNKKENESGLKAEQRDIVFKGLGKFIRKAIADNNNAVKDTQRAESAALRKAAKKEKGMKAKTSSPKGKLSTKSPLAKKGSPKSKKG